MGISDFRFQQAERAYLTPPEPVDPPKCPLCGIHPYDNYLYEEPNEGLMCSECLDMMGYTEEEIERLTKKDIYFDDLDI